MVSGAGEEGGGRVAGGFVVGVVVGDSDGDVVVVGGREVVGVTIFDEAVVIGIEELSKCCRRSTSLLACNSMGSADATTHIDDKIVRISGNNVNRVCMTVPTTTTERVYDVWCVWCVKGIPGTVRCEVGGWLIMYVSKRTDR